MITKIETAHHEKNEWVGLERIVFEQLVDCLRNSKQNGEAEIGKDKERGWEGAERERRKSKGPKNFFSFFFFWFRMKILENDVREYWRKIVGSIGMIFQ